MKFEMIAFESIVSSKKLYLQTLNASWYDCFRIDCVIKKLHSSCYWFSNIFSLYDLFETWSFIRDYKTSIRVILTWLFSNQLFYQMNCIYRISERVTISMTRSNQLYRQKICICRVDFDTFLLCNLIMTCCQCRYVLTDTWVLNCCF